MTTFWFRCFSFLRGVQTSIYVHVVSTDVYMRNRYRAGGAVHYILFYFTKLRGLSACFLKAARRSDVYGLCVHMVRNAERMTYVVFAEVGTGCCCLSVVVSLQINPSCIASHRIAS